MPIFLINYCSRGLFDNFMENTAILAIARQFGYQRAPFSELNSVRGLLQTVVATPAA